MSSIVLELPVARAAQAHGEVRPIVSLLMREKIRESLTNARGIPPVDTRRLVDRAARDLTASVTLPGMFQTTTGNRRRGERHYVVGRAGRPCLRCGTLICATAEVPNDPEQRRTWWCPHCQPAPT
jgi:formamidopyrimidine-DNA glycosylase